MHWRLGPSSAKRWLTCPASAVPSEGQDTEHTRRGTTLHGRAAFKLGLNLPLFATDEDADVLEMSILEVEKIIEPEHEVYIEYTMPSTVVDEFGGTIDVLLYHPGRKEVTVVDFKFGKFRVPAKDNVQLLCYCALAREQFDVTSYRGAIMQPSRRKSLDIVSYTPEEVEEVFQKVVAAQHSDHREASSGCRFCPLLQTCELGQQHMEANPWG